MGMIAGKKVLSHYRDLVESNHEPHKLVAMLSHMMKFKQFMEDPLKLKFHPRISLVFLRVVYNGLPWTAGRGCR